ncbi:MAG: carbonic anhydrase [Oscillospiraceae bacterium]|nr:carbonic anhydrase [Oscillospiraceae bacterium]
MEIEKTLEFNRAFVMSGEHEKCTARKRKAKGIAVVSCMDARLTELLGAALGLRDGDATVIKNAGGIVRDIYGGEIRSLLIAVYELGVTEIMVVGHTDCKVEGLMADKIKSEMLRRGIDKTDVEAVDNEWLDGFADVEDSVRDSVAFIKAHPLIPHDVSVRGFVMDINTGALSEVCAS